MQMLEVSKKLKEKDEFTLFFKGRPSNFFDEFVMSLFVHRLISDYELGIVRGLRTPEQKKNLPSKRRSAFFAGYDEFDRPGRKVRLEYKNEKIFCVRQAVPVMAWPFFFLFLTVVFCRREHL